MINALLAMGKIHSSNNNFSGARYHLEKILKEYPHSELIPEVLYYRSINRYRETKDPLKLRAVAVQLREEYPASIWTRKAAPYMMLTESLKP